MTMAAVVTTYLFGLAYFAVTGIYFFYDSYIPIAVFLGMHLLFTDPSTSPRTELGRIAFGALYGLSTVVLYGVLGRVGAPTFYDKLLQVPLLNLSVIVIDRAARSAVLRRFDPAALGRSLAPRRRHLAYMGVWAVVFPGMSAAGGVGDRHPGQWVPFWQQACEEARPHACGFLAAKQSGLCNMGSGWACNEAGVLLAGLGGLRRLGMIARVTGMSRRCSRSSVGASSGSRRRAGTTAQYWPAAGRSSGRGRVSRIIRSSFGAARGRWLVACESVR